MVVFDQMVDVLANVLASGIAWLNPQALIIGGGIGLASLERLRPLLIQKLNQRLHCYQMEDFNNRTFHTNFQCCGGSLFGIPIRVKKLYDRRWS